MPKHWTRLDRDLFLYRDSCNVYLLRYGDRGLVIDFGTGAWIDQLGEVGIDALDAVVLTHAHRDQLCGLYRGRWPGCPVHAPSGERELLEEDTLQQFWTSYQRNGAPPNYAAPRLPLPTVSCNLNADS